MLLFDGKRAAPFATLGMLLLLATFSTASTEDLGDNVLMPVDLEKTSFDTVLQALPAGRGVLMEFYASWCPACKHFQPHYEKVAAFFYGTPRPKPDVYVARVDCATQGALCSQYNVKHYPTLKFGKPADFKAGQESRLEEYNGVKGEKEIIEWVGKMQSMAYDYDPEKQGQASQQEAPGMETSTSAPKMPQHVDLGDIESSTMLAFRYMADLGSLKGLEKRQALKDWIDLLAASHPIDRCRAGAAAAKEAYPTMWPADQETGPQQVISQLAICGEKTSPKEWGSCRGTRESSRGYTCGLWLLLHSLAARSKPEATGGAFWMTAVRQYIEQFFACTECSQHFGTMAAEEAAAAVTSRRDAVMWAWRAHNIVNKRVGEQELQDHSGDPFFPKIQWPPPELCPLCRVPSLATGQDQDPEWNEDEVYRFLLAYYADSSKLDAAATFFAGRKALRSKVSAAGGSKSLLLKSGGVMVIVLAAYVALRRRQAPTGRRGHSIL